MLVCDNLTRSFGDLLAVDRLSLSVKSGELYGFLGPNGAGKTTTIRIMTGLLRPTAGSACIGGFDIQQNPRQARSIFGYIPDNPFLYDKLTGWEFLTFMADLYSLPMENRKERISELLHLFELDQKGDELIQSYSRGMRQKISLAGALIHNPEIVFLDEPTSGLDPRSARLMKDLLRQLCDNGVTVFISTHILEIAERMCDRFGIIHHGRLIATGTMEELRSHSVAGSESLEDIFLSLTGGEDTC